MINSCVIYHQLLIATDDAIIAFISPGYYQVCFRLTYRPNINNSRPNHCNLPSFSNPTCIAYVMMQNLL